MRRDERSDTDLVLAARADDPAAFGHLFDRWYERSWNVARTILRDDDLAADVAQDALVVAWQQLDQLRNPDAFGGWLLRSTRNRALTRLARERRSTASGDEVVSGLRDRGRNDPTAAEPLPQPDAVNEIRDRQELVWAAAAALGEGDASLLDLHLRHGLTPAEIAEELGVAANAAHQQLFRLRGRLGDAIGSYLLWRNGRPLCEGLAAAVSGRKAFNKSVARAVRKHQASCEQCSEERAALVDPHKLFAAAPLVVVPAGLKAQAAAALEAAGVPMAGATGGSAPDGNGADSGTSADGETGADGGSDAGAEADAPGNTADASGNGSDGSGSEVANTDGADSAGGQGNGAEAGGQAGGGMPNPAPPPTTPPPTPPVLLPSGGPVLLSAPGRGLSARTLSRREILVGAGAGLLTLAILFGMASLVLDSGNGMDLLAGLESSSADEPLAAGQQGNGEQDPSGPASFSRDSARPGEPEATPTTVRSTTRASRPTTSVGTSSTTSTTVDTTSTTVESTTTSSSTTSTTRSTTTSSSTTSTTRDTTTSSSTTSTTRDTTTSSSTTSSTAPPVDPPSFDRASVSPNPSGTCQTPSETPKKVSWAASGATSVSVSGGGISQTGGASGSIPFCAIGTVSISLTAEGPGGRTSTSASG